MFRGELLKPSASFPMTEACRRISVLSFEWCSVGGEKTKDVASFRVKMCEDPISPTISCFWYEPPTRQSSVSWGSRWDLGSVSLEEHGSVSIQGWTSKLNVQLILANHQTDGGWTSAFGGISRRNPREEPTPVACLPVSELCESHAHGPRWSGSSGSTH